MKPLLSGKVRPVFNGCQVPNRTAEPSISVRDVLDRIKEIEGFRYDKEVGELLGVKTSTLDQYKVKKRVPLKQVVAYALERGASLDWILFGRGRAQPAAVGVGESPGIYRIRTDQDSVYDIARDLFRAVQSKHRCADLSPEKFAHILKLMHRESLELNELPSQEKLEMIVELTD